MAQGIYSPGSSGFDTYEILLNNLQILGGFRGVSGGGDPDDRDIENFVTTLSGEVSGSPVIDTIVTIGNGVTQITETTLLEGFTIEDGQGPSGAGITCIGGSTEDVWPHIRACTLTDNTATSSGGGAIKCNGTYGPTSNDFLVIRNCTMTGNEAQNSGRGGAVSIVASSFSLTRTAVVNCTITDNEATGSSGCGGGIHVETDTSSTVHVVSTTLEDNYAQFKGGGLSTKVHIEPTQVVLTNVAVVDNDADDGAGGIYNMFGSLEVTNCTFSDNIAGGDGGAYFEERDSGVGNSSAILNSIF